MTTVDQRQGRYVGRGLLGARTSASCAVRRATSTTSNCPEMAHIAFVRSPHAHARVEGIAVGDLPAGVLAVITPADLAGRVRPFPKVALDDMEISDDQHPILAGDEVRYVGQPVVAVVAESRALAEDGVEVVVVDFEPLDAVVDPFASDHAAVRWSRSRGDVDGAFSGAAHVVEGRYGMPRVTSVPMEPRGAVARDDPGTGVVTIWCSQQDPHRPLAQLVAHPHASRRHDPPDRARRRRRVRHEGQHDARGGGHGDRRDRPRPAGEVGRGPARELPDQPAGPRHVGRRRARPRRRRPDPRHPRADGPRPRRLPAALDAHPAAHRGHAHDRLLRHPGGRRGRRRGAHAQGPDRAVPRRRAARRRRTSSSSPSTTRRARSAWTRSRCGGAT